MITGSRARCLRVALGLDAGTLADRLQMRVVDVLRAEDGDHRPRCGWERWEQVLDAELVRWVAADGRPWTEIWPTPFEASRLRRAASAGQGHGPRTALGVACPPSPVDREAGVTEDHQPRSFTGPSEPPTPSPNRPDFGADLDW